jgi:hypothetical protein
VSIPGCPHLNKSQDVGTRFQGLDERTLPVAGKRKQFGRCGCAFTPACGSEEGAWMRGVAARLTSIRLALRTPFRFVAAL